MILSIIAILSAMVWLAIETKGLTVNLAYVKPAPVQCIEQHKHSPILEPCRIVNAPYPKPEPIKLISQYCGFTELQRKIIKEKWRVDADNPYHYNTYAWQISASYQQMNIGGHSISLLATSSKLYDTIAEFQRIVDGKDRKPVLKFAPINNFNPLCGKEWYNEHYQDVMPEQFIELKVNDKSISFDGDFKTGKIKEFIKANK